MSTLEVLALILAGSAVLYLVGGLIGLGWMDTNGTVSGIGFVVNRLGLFVGIGAVVVTVFVGVLSLLGFTVVRS